MIYQCGILPASLLKIPKISILSSNKQNKNLRQALDFVYHPQVVPQQVRHTFATAVARPEWHGLPRLLSLLLALG